MINVKKFQMKHLDKFECSNFIPDLKLSMVENDMNPKMDIVSLIDQDGNVVALAGVNHLRLGVGEVWIIRSELINDHKFDFYKTINGLIDFLFLGMGLHRVELAIICSWSGGAKWAQSLGFKFESITRAYDYQFNDHAIYTKIKKGLA